MIPYVKWIAKMPYANFGCELMRVFEQEGYMPQESELLISGHGGNDFQSCADQTDQ
ncbi:hypothetical protein Q669_21415 [Labrenzia sp. C1B10]|jgi:hypothetical protein|nr:hypothetical protein Q669_21415 [Labrenzia sp. C1B10]ERS01559.1 hypothetical protein Q675_05530 [Labrenzia sp. C1B70]